MIKNFYNDTNNIKEFEFVPEINPIPTSPTSDDGTEVCTYLSDDTNSF